MKASLNSTVPLSVGKPPEAVVSKSIKPALTSKATRRKILQYIICDIFITYPPFKFIDFLLFNTKFTPLNKTNKTADYK